MQKKVLGLDIGIASIGWAFVTLDEEVFDADEEKLSEETRLKITNGEIKGLGVRTFQPPLDDKNKSLALHRGECRRTRSTIERRAERLKFFVKLAKKHALISDNFSADSFEQPKETVASETDVWMLRKKGLYQKLSDFDFFRVLYHIAKHRGFYFPTKAERNQIDVPEKNAKSKKTSEDKEDKKIKSALKAICEKFKSSQAQTIGELYMNEHPFPDNKAKEFEISRKHNSEGIYDLSIPRELLLDETQKLFECQRKFENTKATADFEKEYIHQVLMYDYLDDLSNQDKYTRKLRRMMGRCEFFPEEECCPKESYSAEIFSFYNRLNALRLYRVANEAETNGSFSFRSGSKNEDESLSEETRKKILELVLSKSSVSFCDLRKTLNLEPEIRFNLCSYREKNPEYTKYITVERVDKETVALKKDDKKEYNFDLYRSDTGEDAGNYQEKFLPKAEALFKKYPKLKEKKYSFDDVRKMIALEAGVRFVALKKDYMMQPAEMKNGIKDYLKQFEKEDFFEMKGYHKIKSKFKTDFEQINTPEKLDNIAEALTKYKTDNLRQKFLKENGFSDQQIGKVLELNMSGLAHFSFKALHKLNPFLENGKRFDEAKKEAGLSKPDCQKNSLIPEYDGFFKNNPAVARIIGQVRKVVNAIVRTYGKPDEIHIEVATDVANSKKKKSLIADGQRRYKEAKERAKERCLEFGLDPEEGANLLRFRLAEEQDFRCPYTGRAIVKDADAKNLCITDCEIDHIIPFSRSFNDSLSNKVLCAPSANQEKKNQLPFEWLKGHENSEEWQEFKVRLKTMRLPYQKQKNLLREHFDEKDREGFISRNLNDTRYACRHIAEYLREHFDFSESERKDIKDVNRIRVFGGGITASLRHMWGLEKIRDENSRHHALDAVVIACTTFGHVYFICNIKKKCEESGKNFFKNSKIEMRPWLNISEEIKDKVSKIFVSRMCRHSATGEGHDIFSREKGKYPVNRDGNIKGKAKSLGNMFRFDVFKDENGNFSVFPVYAIDVHGYKYPKEDEQGNTVFVTKEQMLREAEKTAKFVSSLYKDDYVQFKVKKENAPIEGYIVKYNGDSTGQFILKAADDSYAYQTRSSTFEIDDRLLLDGQVWKVSSFNKETGCLEIINGKSVKELPATVKKGKGDKVATEQTYTKLSKEKTAKYTEFEQIKKYQVDPLGNRVEVKSEKRLPVNSVKSNRQRRQDRYKLDIHKKHSEKA